MKVIIMAAGRGTRISRYIHGKPKCTVDVGGMPLIQHTFELLASYPENDIAIVTGYNENEILKIIQPFRYQKFYNPFFDITNSIVSLWFAREFISPDEDLIILNGDLFFEKELFDILLKEKKTPVMLSDSSRIESADYRFQWEKDLLKKYGKELSNEETTGEYVGIGKIQREFIPRFMDRMETLINSQQHGKWWEDILYSFVEESRSIHIRDIKGLFWAEVDYIEDYERIIEYVKTGKKS